MSLDGVSLDDHPDNAFEVLGPHYDSYTSGDNYQIWGNHIARLAANYDVTPPARALDLACGTGKSTRELVRHGFEVDGCDISPVMLDQARRQPDLQDVHFFRADMRDLEASANYELINCMDDAINFLAGVDDLAKVFHGVATLLSPRGVFIFDVNTCKTYSTWYSEIDVSTSPAAVFIWHGKTPQPFVPGGVADADLYILEDAAQTDRRTWSLSRHSQRHFTQATITANLTAAGLDTLGVFGLERRSPLDPADEERHGKAVYVARRVS